MTTIVANKQEMASDLQWTIDGRKTKGKTKVFKFEAHEMHFNEDFIIGFAGQASSVFDVVDFFTTPENYKGMPRVRGVSGVVLTKSGKLFHFDNPSKWIAVDGAYAVAGSGATAAAGAMLAGATPKEAVLAASKVDIYSGMGVKVESF
jgi:ATP-dependent protease HslVU (ClpYQ) peptidase subunit